MAGHNIRITWVIFSAVLILVALMVALTAMGRNDFYNIPIIMSVLILLIIFLVITAFLTRGTTALLQSDRLNVRGHLFNEKVPYGEIISVEMRDGFDYGNFKAGYADLKRLGGQYNNNEFGTYYVSAKIAVKEHIVVHRINGKVLVFNLETPEATIEFYDKLKKRTGK
ncbi:MAG: hypothetical protein FWC44_00960 [Methanomassiliicoccaceae archaeon]|nr:hypothetical protein [Methanomassiliicoccaceae archaeon]